MRKRIGSERIWVDVWLFEPLDESNKGGSFDIAATIGNSWLNGHGFILSTGQTCLFAFCTNHKMEEPMKTTDSTETTDKYKQFEGIKKTCTNCAHHLHALSGENKSRVHGCLRKAEVRVNLISGGRMIVGEPIPCDEERYTDDPSKCGHGGQFFTPYVDRLPRYVSPVVSSCDDIQPMGTKGL